MPKQILDYQYIEGELSPCYFVLQLYKNEVDWEKHVFYFELLKPIKSEEYSEFDGTLISCSVPATDLIISNTMPNNIGINLNSVKKRLTSELNNPSAIEQFIIYAPDLDFILSRMPENLIKSFFVLK